MNNSRAIESLSLCICTYNRSDKLKRLLSTINDKLRIPEGIEFEIICVDNNSSDDTRVIAESFKDDLPLTVLTETKQGLSSARNRAVEASKGDWVVFIDDDVLPADNFLEAYVNTIINHDVDFMGGRVLLNWIEPKPKWLINEDLPLLSGVLVKFDLGNQVLPFLSVNELPRGANFAMSKVLSDKVGAFNTKLGVSGVYHGRAEETEYFSRAQEAGFVGFYCGTALCYHDGLTERLNLSYALKHGAAKGKAEYLLGNAELSKMPSEFSLWIKAFHQFIKGRKDRYLQTVINIGMRRGYFAAQKVALIT